MGVHIFGKSIKHNALVKVCILGINFSCIPLNEKVNEYLQFVLSYKMLIHSILTTYIDRVGKKDIWCWL